LEEDEEGDVIVAARWHEGRSIRERAGEEKATNMTGNGQRRRPATGSNYSDAAMAESTRRRRSSELELVDAAMVARRNSERKKPW